MNANELRIGNWVNLEFVGPFEWEAKHFDDYIKDPSTGYDLPTGTISDKIEPIPLTPEILEKAGFQMLSKNEFIFNRYSIRKEKRLDDPVWEVYLHGNDAKFHWIKNIGHLHQLQNLYFALTGKELEIKELALTTA